MVLKEFDIELDVKRSSANRPIEVVEGDNGNRLNIILTDNGEPVDLTGCLVVAVFAKTDGTTVQQDNGGHGITMSEEQNNQFTIDLYTSSFAPGLIECEILVFSGENQDTQITSAKFNFSCRRSIMNEDTVQATDEYPILVELIQRTEAAEEGLSTIGANESTRQSNETTRQSQEEDREDAEEARETAEGLRITTEQGRVIAEQGRVIAESGRVSAESGRASAESGRASAESTRATNETARGNAETARASAETTRITNETAREQQKPLGHPLNPGASRLSLAAQPQRVLEQRLKLRVFLLRVQGSARKPPGPMRSQVVSPLNPTGQARKRQGPMRNRLV